MGPFGYRFGHEPIKVARDQVDLDVNAVADAAVRPRS